MNERPNSIYHIFYLFQVRQRPSRAYFAYRKRLLKKFPFIRPVSLPKRLSKRISKLYYLTDAHTLPRSERSNGKSGAIVRKDSAPSICPFDRASSYSEKNMYCKACTHSHVLMRTYCTRTK